MALQKKVASIITTAKVGTRMCPKCKAVFASEDEQKKHKCDINEEAKDDEK